MKTYAVECLLRQLNNALDTLITVVEAGGGGGGGGGGGATRITSPNVSTYNDSRGISGDWSYNPTLNGGTMFFKVDSSPHTWISWAVAQS